MRFVLVFFLIAAAYARPDVGLGYNYNTSPGDSSSSGNYAPQAPIISKKFYLHTAPEERDARTKHFQLGKPQKNYRVVFIKTPAAPPFKLSAEYPPNEEKTAIYVLSQKEHDIGEIATPAPTQPSKPEVFFVKYKTPQEAEHAQRQIQAQYDALGGSSQFSDEGIAPLSSVIGSFGPQSNQNGYLPPNKNNYLPPSRRH